MNRKKYLAEIIEEFEKWYNSDEHKKNIDFYKHTINEEYLESLSKNQFKNFFYKFVSDGGRVQSGGERSKNKFIKTLDTDFLQFKKFILEPFNKDFELKEWFDKINKFKYFGVGIATIYLNRINKFNYPIMNNKTINALNKLGYTISSTKNFSNYQLIKNIQLELKKDFPTLNNLYKIDALNHFIIAIEEGKILIEKYIHLNYLEDKLEQDEIENILDSKQSPKQLLQHIRECEKEDNEYINIKGKRIKRHNYLMVQIKKYRGYKCQFCDHSILKENGTYYIEACHIKAKCDGGKDKLENILILCPNCHKLFDNWKHEDEQWTEKEYTVFLNNTKYRAKIR